ncbi:MAG: hypothetical protein GY822_20320 [Deltaproteobacteria bacterium]|nr:hypothetical protein [Deltaproteobacteria bacterium]
MFCSAKKDTRTVGVTVELKVSGAEWRAKRAGRRFGTRTCEGSNPSLAVTERNQKGSAVVFKCRSTRVTRGTERTSHIVEALTEQKVKFKTVSERYFRKRGEDCRLKVTRITVATLVQKKQDVVAEKVKEPEKVVEKDPCASPGAITKLQLSPRVFDAKVGGKPTCLEVLAFDANQCPVAVNTEFSVDPIDVGTVSAKGCFTASKKIEEEEEEEAAAIIVRAGGREAAASVRIIPKAKEKAQKSYKALAKTTRSKRAREVLGSVTRGEIVLRPLETEPPILPDLEDESIPWIPLIIAGLLAFFRRFPRFYLRLSSEKETSRSN